MDNSHCPNFNNCKLISEPGFTSDETQQQTYISQYCQSDSKRWESCKRLIVKKALNFCPDFVLPDTELSVDEIIDKFDNEQIN